MGNSSARIRPPEPASTAASASLHSSTPLHPSEPDTTARSASGNSSRLDPILEKATTARSASGNSSLLDPILEPATTARSASGNPSLLDPILETATIASPSLLTGNPSPLDPILEKATTARSASLQTGSPSPLDPILETATTASPSLLMGNPEAATSASVLMGDSSPLHPVTATSPPRTPSNLAADPPLLTLPNNIAILGFLRRHLQAGEDLPVWIHPEDVYSRHPALLATDNHKLTAADGACCWFFLSPVPGKWKSRSVRSGEGYWKAERKADPVLFYAQDGSSTELGQKLSLTHKRNDDRQAKATRTGFLMKELLLTGGPADRGICRLYKSTWGKSSKSRAATATAVRHHAPTSTASDSAPAAAADIAAPSSSPPPAHRSPGPTSGTPSTKQWLSVQIDASASPAAAGHQSSIRRVFSTLVSDGDSVALTPSKKRKLNDRQGWILLETGAEKPLSPSL